MLGAASTALGKPEGGPVNSTTAKNLIFLVSDGMNQGTLSLANHYWEEFKGQSCAWMRMYQGERPFRRALMETSSASSLVTDSAAAGSSWSCGQRINNGNLNISVNGEHLRPLYDFAKQRGKATGLVTTTRVTHATPASFAVNEKDRNAEDAIARQFLGGGLADIILGGGSKHFDPAKRADGADMFTAFKALGYDILHSRDDLLKLHETAKQGTAGDRWLGTFTASHLPYTVDRRASAELQAKVPTLAEMMTAALEKLQHASEGFLLQVEAGRVDHAGHANDAGAILFDQLSFDECIVVAEQFVENHPDTLVIVTTDHGTGGAMLNGLGSKYNDTTKQFMNLDGLAMSFEVLTRQLATESTPAQLKELVAKGWNMELDDETARNLLANMSNRNVFSDLLSPHVMQHTGVGFTSHNHTGDLVELMAFGAGLDVIPPYLENWQLHGLIRQCLGI